LVVATHHANDSIAPPKDRGDAHLAAFPQHADFSAYALNKPQDNAIFQAAQPRNDMADLQKHGFASHEQLLGSANASAAAPPGDATHPKDLPAATPAAPENVASNQPDANASPTTTEIPGSHIVVDRPTSTTVGVDQKVAFDAPPTTVTTDAPSTGTTSPVDAVDSRATAAPVEQAQAQPQHDAAPQNYAQNDQPRIAPPPSRADLG
jgi:hypothetical protein